MISEDERRFWAKVRWEKRIRPNMRTLCWVYGAGGRYGMITVDGKPFNNAHEYSWTLKNGPKPPEGFVLHHLCEVKRCVNPAHLVMATAAGHIGQLHALTFKAHFPCGCPFDEDAPLVNAAGYRVCAVHQPIPESCKAPEQVEHLARVAKLANVYGIGALNKLGPFPQANNWLITQKPIPEKYFARVNELYAQLG